MKLTYFSVANYRSIATAKLENLQSSAILIGPNNEGKSNVLQGLNACLALLRASSSTRMGGQLQLRYDRDWYDWSTDYPIKRQVTDKSGESVFELHFELTEVERTAFSDATGSKLNDVLPIQLCFGPTQYASFKVLKQGRGGAALSKKSVPICQFIARTLDFVYIPAVRTADAALEVVNELVNRELRKLEGNERYAALQKEISELQKPLLDNIGTKLKGNLQAFLGTGLRGVSLALVDRYRSSRIGKTCQITVDDGTPTLLERKGDGVQSLAAISLMIGALEETGSDKDIIVLLEEPESHLHPRAIHQLRDVLDTLRQDSQLILTTHCPLLVNRANVSSNLVVSKNKAFPAESLSILREILGVRASDNLQHAALVLVVEGPEDEVALRALLPHYSSKVGNALSTGSLAFLTLGGASKLPYALAQLQSSICNYVIFVDDDDEGRKGYAEAQKSLLASPANTTFTRCLGMPEAEFEDLLHPDIYAGYFKTKYGIEVRNRPFDAKEKWSKRIRAGMIKAGKSGASGEGWPERDEYEDKRAIADCVKANPGVAIHPAREDMIKTFTAALEVRLAALATGQRL